MARPRSSSCRPESCGRLSRPGRGSPAGRSGAIGQGPHSHDLQARADVSTYTPLPYEPGVARLAADLHVDGEPHPFCPRVNLKRMLRQALDRGYTFNVGIEPEFFLVTRRPDGSIEGWDPDGVDRLRKALLRLQGTLGRAGLPQGDDRRPRLAGLGAVSGRSRGRQLPVRDQLPLCRRPHHRPTDSSSSG